MMELIMSAPPVQQSQQDMDLIDILWRQDIDLGAGREVFDYNQRQREHELEKQKQLERERLEQLQKEKEKTLLAQLQLDEETGEFVPILPAQHIKTENLRALSNSSQNIAISEQDGDALSFDECMQLLAETFPFVENVEAPSAALQASIPTQPDNSPVFMAPHNTQPAEPSLLQTLPESCTVPGLEETWQELLSIPELQCLNIENGNTAEATTYQTDNEATQIQNEDCTFFNLFPMIDKQMQSCSESSLQIIENSHISAVPSNDPISSNILTADTPFSAGGFCDAFYSGLVNSKGSDIVPTENMNQSLTDLLIEPPLDTLDITDLAICQGYGGGGGGSADAPDFPDSDSGLAMDESPRASSPRNSKGSSVFGDAPFGFSDSDMEDMDSSPGSVKQDYATAYPVHFQGDGPYQISSPLTSLEQPLSVQSTSSPKKELPVSPGHSKAPFTKDKQSSRMESRLSRDEQRAKALNIPFSAEKIINLPVDDFNEIMSKHQFNEAQLALIRDIRRRGKNKVAAQNCRKRKLESIVGLEHDLDQLKLEKDKLLQEKGEYDRSLREAKQQLSSLYHEVFSRLRDEDGKPYSPSEYSLQQTRDGNVFLVPKSKKPELKRD